jgi:hypothetical protein
VLPEDVWALAPDVLRHRMVLSYEALAEEVTAEMLVDQVVRKIPIPQLGLPGEDNAPYKEESILRANTDQQEQERRRWRIGRRKSGAA